MTFQEYQQEAITTKIYKDEIAIPYVTLGLVGESGEVAEKIKKYLRGDFEMTDEVKTELAKELGDVLWYIAAFAEEINIDLDTIAQMNIDKLASRKQRNVLAGDGDNR